MAATRRLQKELGDLRKAAGKSFRDIQVDESNLLVWQGLLVPDSAPYNKVPPPLTLFLSSLFSILGLGLGWSWS